jgi:hypothetical protein
MSEEISLPTNNNKDLGVKMASEEITSKRHADFRNWYDMPDGTTLGILDDIDQFKSCGRLWTQTMAGKISVVTPTLTSTEGET